MATALTRDEVVLVFHLWLKYGSSLSETSPKMMAFSALLRRLDIHPLDVRVDPSFRPPDGLVGRLRRFTYLEQGKTQLVPALYHEVWNEFHERRSELEEEVARILEMYDSTERGNEASPSEAVTRVKHLGVGGGEDGPHLHLKQHSVAHPEELGLSRDSQPDIEPTFLSSDRTEEVESEVTHNFLIRAWQALKHRVLSAVEKLNGWVSRRP